MRGRQRAVTAFSCALVVSMLASAADALKLNVKLGLWEVTTTGKSEGAVPEELLARLTPERRERMIAAMKASGGKSHTSKRCVTAAQLAQSFGAEGKENDTCQRTVVSNSATEMNVHTECSTGDGKRTSNARFHADNSETVTGKVNIVMTHGGKSMTFDSDVHAKWLSASCGDLKDDSSAN